MVYSADQNQAVTLALSTKLWPISLIVSYLTPPFLGLLSDPASPHGILSVQQSFVHLPDIQRHLNLP